MNQQKKKQALSYDAPGKDRIKYIIAVASGKGGTGKSTVTANIALALVTQGYSVGVLDADIYGPSQGRMLGAADDTRPKVVKIKEKPYYLPVLLHELQVMSMAFLTDERTPMIWRGPMASGALQQMLLQTYWDGLDILLVDMPPGTGDIQLTLSQKISLSGSLIVTTPQDIALLDAQRAIEMFNKVNVPVLGVVENMAWHTCPQCGHKESVFGKGGGKKLSDEYSTLLLGSVPLALSIREQADSGTPSVVAAPDGEYALAYKKIATQLTKQLNKADTSQLPDIHTV